MTVALAGERDASSVDPHDASRTPGADASVVAVADASRPAAAQHDASRHAGAGRRVCAWCRGAIPADLRADAVCCSVRCRQARHRFTTGVGRARATAATPLRIAYADPPYPGRSRRYYGNHPDYAGEVDHAQLVARLAEFDGWALSTAADALPAVLALCPPGTRVAAWVRGERPGPSRRPLNAWEPVLYRPARPVQRTTADRVTDTLVLRPGTRRTDPARVVGAKPAEFARWVFELTGALAGDDMTDLFPGSGGIARAWTTYTGGTP